MSNPTKEQECYSALRCLALEVPETVHADVVNRVHAYVTELKASRRELATALHMLYEETADYIRVNKLGDVHHNQSMKVARKALKKAGVL